MTLTNSPSVSVSTLAGYRVRSHDHEDLGAIEEIIIHPESGRIAYAVLCFSAEFGLGDRLFAIPWELLHLDPEDRVLILVIDTSNLAGAPAFDQDDWPDFTDKKWEREIQEYYEQVKPAGS